ncbi:type II toxin-antitoxin system Phd/YefM family antitoxin [Microgenomates group bacterium]|nr:type II toxin-antitoxin system Phd/YefM family antitoxin [Microgenomates group bacterium]
MNNLTISLDQLVSFSQARANLADLIDLAPKKKFFIITRRNKPIIALVDIKFLEELLLVYNAFMKRSQHKNVKNKTAFITP